MADTNTSVLKKLQELDGRCLEIAQQINNPEIASDPNKLIPLSKELRILKMVQSPPMSMAPTPIYRVWADQIL